MRGYWINFSILLFHTPVAQRSEAAVSKPVNVWVSPNGDATRTIPARSTNYAPVAQLEEAIALEAMRCRFNSCQEYQTSGCNSVVRSLGLGPRSRGFKSYHPDHLPL